MHKVHSDRTAREMALRCPGWANSGRAEPGLGGLDRAALNFECWRLAALGNTRFALHTFTSNYLHSTTLGYEIERPTVETLARWMADCPPDVLAESERRLSALWGRPGQWLPVGDKDRATLLVATEATDASDHIWTFGDVFKRYYIDGPGPPPAGKVRAPGFDHPLPPLLKAWFASHPVPTEPGRHERPIVPASFAKPRQRPLFHLPAPNIPGPAVVHPAYLPGLEPDTPPSPALLLAMFDASGGVSLTKNGKVSSTASIWLEAMLDVPPSLRDGRLRETRYPIREVAGDWLDWKLYNYRPSGVKTGRALARALYDVRGLWVPMNDRGGGYFPVGVSAVSGWELDDKVAFAVRLPRGEVGPQVDRALLRSLRDNGPAYRLYLSLCFEWDKYGARKGKLTLPTRPEVRRAEGGQIVDAKGNIITGRGNVPVYSVHDRRAIKTGRRELNPARSNYPSYSPDDRVALAFPARVFEDRHRRTMFRSRADKAVKRLEEAGVVVERESGLWRIMPPDPSARELLALPPAEKL